MRTKEKNDFAREQNSKLKTNFTFFQIIGCLKQKCYQENVFHRSFIFENCKIPVAWIWYINRIFSGEFHVMQPEFRSLRLVTEIQLTFSMLIHSFFGKDCDETYPLQSSIINSSVGANFSSIIFF